MKYDCGKEVNLLYTLPRHEQSTNINLENTLVGRLLDYFFYSKHLVPSLDQLGFGGYIFIGIMKWTWDKRAFNKINSVFSLIGFLSLKKMTDTQSRIFFSKYSNGFSTGNILCSSYRKILKVIEEADGEVKYGKNKIDDNTYSAIIE